MRSAEKYGGGGINSDSGAWGSLSRERDEDGGSWDSLAKQEFTGGQTENDDVDPRMEGLDSKHEKRILAYMSGRGFNNWKDVTPGDIEKVRTRWKDADTFFDAQHDFLEDIRNNNSEQKYQEYLKAMDLFTEKVWNKDEEEDTLVNIGEQSDYERNLEKLRDVKIEGDSYICQGNEYLLSRETLAQCDLAPDSMMNLEGREIQMSKVFKVGERDAIIGYVRDDEGKLKARSYYRSNSQGVWRYLPDYTENSDGSGGIGWYGKGYDEAMLTLPAELQAALNYQASHRPQAETGNVSTSYLLAGTAKRYKDKYDYRMAMLQGTLEGDVYDQVSREPKFKFGKMDFDKTPPEYCPVAGRLWPDFAKMDGSYQVNTSLAGSTNVETFSSYDNQLKWTMCSDSYGRAWVGGIETTSQITNTGLRSEWVQPGDIATPLYEYRSMASGYGDNMDPKGSYVGMWSNYLSKMPIIRAYVRSKSNLSRGDL